MKDITEVLAAFETHCVTEMNVIYERYILNHCDQESGDTTDHYITDVIKLAENCQYGGLQELREGLIWDKLASGIRE